MIRVDFRFPGTPIFVEVLGYRYHRTPDQLRRDAERTNALVAAGYRPYQFSYEQVVESPTEVIEQTRCALAAWS
jgi:very-short-patch-repair endonuclease